MGHNNIDNDVHLLGMISLRALAEVDPLEYRRTTDVSPYVLDDAIGKLLATSTNQQAIDLHRRMLLAFKLNLTHIRTIALDEIRATGLSAAQTLAVSNG